MNPYSFPDLGRVSSHAPLVGLMPSHAPDVGRVPSHSVGRFPVSRSTTAIHELSPQGFSSKDL